MLLCLLCPQLHYAICLLATYSLAGDCAYTPACLCAPTYDVYRVACVQGRICAACKSLHCMHLMSPVLHLGLLHHTLQCLPAIDGDARLHVYLHQMLLSCTCTTARAATTFVTWQTGMCREKFGGVPLCLQPFHGRALQEAFGKRIALWTVNKPHCN